MRHTKTVETILFGILFLFFLQSLSDFIEAIYAFGLLVTAFTIQIASIILLFTPLLLIFFRKGLSRPWMLILAYAAIFGRLAEPMLDPGGKLVASGISVGAFLLLFPLLLWNNKDVKGWRAGSGLVIALALSILLRTVNSGLDASEFGSFQLTGWLLAGVAAALLWQADLNPRSDLNEEKTASGTRINASTLGLASVILMIYFAFSSPTVIARWTGFSYPTLIIILAVVLAAFAALYSTGRFPHWVTPRLVLGWNVLFIAAIVLTILPHQIAFPSTPSAYPLPEPAVSSLAAIPLIVMLILSPILFIDFILYARQISAARPSIRQLGGAFALVSLFLLIMVFFHVFTTIYDYAPGIGPLFRDRFWFVYLLVGLGMGLPLLQVRGQAYDLGAPEVGSLFTPILVGALGTLSVIAVFVNAPKPIAPQATNQLKIMTYNIQQGFDRMGNKNLEGQLAVIHQVNPDILGLEESDTARVANGNADAVRYFADNLHMYSYYGPTTTVGTFGIALLSKYPIGNATTFFLYSTGEQTAAIHAQINVDGKTQQVFVTHLGNDGPLVQLQDLLANIDGFGNVITMGDFNFGPATEQYSLMTRSLKDSWLLKWPNGKEIPGISSKDRIDFIFVSPNTPVLESEYVVNPASDHPSLYTVIQP